MNINTTDFTKLKVANYNRKSSESEDKQMLSIQSQVDEANRIAEFHKLMPFVESFKESKSAKTEYARPEFTRMMNRIRKGEINAIVCWKADRLARNMTEGGQIIDLLSSGILKAIITHDKVFYPWDNVIILSVEFSQGKQFVKELSINVKRGQEKKARLGTPHGVATLGFLNDKTEEKGNRKWLVDETRLNAIKILLDMFLTGTYSAGKLHTYAINDLKLTTVKRKRSGGALIVLSRMHEILKDPVYAGFFFLGGQRYELDSSLPKLITEEQHNKIKTILAGKNIPKIQKHETLFSGFITSDEGDSMGQDVKFQLICDCKKKFAYRNKTHCPFCNREIDKLKNPKYLDFTYYYNVRKKKNRQEYRSISKTDIEEKLLAFMDTYLNFSEDLAVWSRQHLSLLKDKEINETLFRKQKEEVDTSEYEAKKARLRVMLRDENITDEEYRIDLEGLNKRYSVNSEAKKKEWYPQLNRIVDITTTIKKTLEYGEPKAKRNILSEIGSNLTWNDKNLLISNSPEVNKLVECIKGIKSKFPEFEPKNFVIPQGINKKTGTKNTESRTWLRG